jgi:hypothetical protein
VLFERGGVARNFLDSETVTPLVQVHAYPLMVSPRYQAAEGKHETPVVHVYRVK